MHAMGARYRKEQPPKPDSAGTEAVVSDLASIKLGEGGAAVASTQSKQTAASPEASPDAVDGAAVAAASELLCAPVAGTELLCAPVDDSEILCAPTVDAPVKKANKAGSARGLSAFGFTREHGSSCACCGPSALGKMGMF